MRDESELIRAAAAGDRDAFAELVRLKRERIVRTARQITGDLDEAMDVAQVVLVKLWKGLDRYDTRRKFDTWIYRVTVNAAIDHLRSQGPRSQLRPLPEPGEGAEPAADERGVDERVDLGRLQEAFTRLSAGLAPQQRAVFVLREIEGLSTAEIARVLDVADSTVRNHLMQARRLLREGLARDYPDWVPGGKERK